jgi:hypothetical protein
VRFSNGVYAQITLKEDTSKSYCFYDNRSVYDFLIEHFDHNIAVDAQCWTEVAGVGEWYEEDEFEIEMMEE